MLFSMMTLPASLVRKSIFFCRWTFKVHIIYDFVLINFSKKNIDLGRQIFCPKWNPHEKISWHFYFTSTHLLHFRLLCPCSNSEVRNVRPNRSSICIRSVNTGEKDLIESIYNVLGIGKLWLETCFFFSREKDTYDVFNKLRSVTSYSFYGLKYVNFAVLDDLFDTSIGSAVHSSSGLTIPKNCKQTVDKNVNKNIFATEFILR